MESGAKKNEPLSVAVVFGSGGARGWAHVGVLRALRELDFTPGLVVGASIGSVAAAVHASNNLAAVEQLALDMDWRKAAALFFEIGLPRSGLLEGRRIMELLRELIPARHIGDLAIRYAAVATDLRTQQEVVLSDGDLLEAIRASISIPGIFTPARHEGRWLVDGGLVNPLPVSVARGLGAAFVVAVDINLREGAPAPEAHPQPETARSSRDKLGALSRWISRMESDRDGEEADETGLRRALENLFGMHDSPRNATPTMLEVLTRSLRAGENAITRERLLREPPDVLIQPEVGHLGTLEFHRSAEAIRAGYTATLAQADALRALQESASRL